MIGKADPPKPPQHVSTRKLGCTSEVRISSGFRHQPAKVRNYCTNWFPEGRGSRFPQLVLREADPPGTSVGVHPA